MGSANAARMCGLWWRGGGLCLVVWDIGMQFAPEGLKIPTQLHGLLGLSIVLSFVVWNHARTQAEVVTLREEITALHAEVHDHFLKFRSPADLLALNDTNLARGHITDIYESGPESRA